MKKEQHSKQYKLNLKTLIGWKCNYNGADKACINNSGTLTSGDWRAGREGRWKIPWQNLEECTARMRDGQNWLRNMSSGRLLYIHCWTLRLWHHQVRKTLGKRLYISLKVFMMLWLRSSFFWDVTCQWPISSQHFKGKVSSKHGKMTGSYEHSNVPIRSIKWQEFLDYGATSF